MVRAVGVDPGTGSMDILGFDDNDMKVFLDASIPRDEVTRDPSIPLRVIVEHTGGEVDAIVAPSGYGMPLVRVQEAPIEYILEATFVHNVDARRRLRIIGLRELMIRFRESDLPAWFTPGVVHLKSVPDYRKMGRIDMGTADKVYTVAAALRDEVEAYGYRPEDSSFIVVEAGYAYTAVIAVRNGVIVDGIGGTSGWWGFLGGGFMDSEVAYAMAHVEPSFSKSRLFEGGASSLIGSTSLEELVARYRRGDDKAVEAVEMLTEGMVKGVLAMLASNPKPNRLYMSGRLFRLELIGEQIKYGVKEALDNIGISIPIASVTRLGSRTKEGATGAAIIANGLAGGRYKWVVESLRLKSSGGSIFDNVPYSSVSMKMRSVFTSQSNGT
ncbi:MAG: DUF1464 family protein [Desulfurococcales archaeon]|nr:DUF1464 family protein [Desulfurococcales archaeon]